MTELRRLQAEENKKDDAEQAALDEVEKMLNSNIGGEYYDPDPEPEEQR